MFDVPSNDTMVGIVKLVEMNEYLFAVNAYLGGIFKKSVLSDWIEFVIWTQVTRFGSSLSDSWFFSLIPLVFYQPIY